MTGSIRLLSVVAAGLVAHVGAASPAAAHDPPSPPRPVQAARPALTTGEPGPNASSGMRSLRDLSDGGRTVVVGRIMRTDTFDGEKVLIYRVTVERVLRGAAPGSPLSLVDVRAGLQRPPLLADGLRAVLVVEPAPPLSYLRQTLPEESSLSQLAGGRDGVFPVASDADLEGVVEILNAADRVRAAADREARERELRRLAFLSLDTAQPRLVADGLLELRRLPRQLSLTPDDLTTLGRVLRDGTIPVPTRVGIIRLLGQREWQGALAALSAVTVDRPDVLAALLEARAQLGAPATRKDLLPYLTSADPATQAAAVGALARLDDPSAIDDLGRWAVTDGDPTVRESAIVALGQSKRPEAARYLQQTFASPNRTLMQASARALLELDEAAGNAAFTELALRGTSSDTRRYAALLLVTTRGREHPAVRQLLASNPDAEVRHVIEHGIEMRDVHGND